MATPLQKAKRLQQAGQFLKARAAYERILRKDPNDVNALHYLGLVLQQLGQQERGIRLIRKAIRLYPAHFPAWLNLANLYQESGAFEEAVEAYRKVIEIQPTHVLAHCYLCMALVSQGQYDDALEASQTATRLDPENTLAWLCHGKALEGKRQYRRAMEAYKTVLAWESTSFAARSGLCRSVYEWELKAEGPGSSLNRTRTAYREWKEVDPENAIPGYMLDSIEGSQAVKRTPEEFVESLFDRFSENYDQSLSDLDYRLPGLMTDLLSEFVGPPGPALHILDAGCGTGLLAADLRSRARQLTGVDLSSGMLDKARARDLYDELVQAELTGFLMENTAEFDVVVCADTLIYFGELEEVVGAMQQALKSGGVLMASFEHLNDGDAPYRLNRHGRFSHLEDYVRRCLVDSGMVIDEIRHEILRSESEQPVPGLVVVARNP